MTEKYISASAMPKPWTPMLRDLLLGEPDVHRDGRAKLYLVERVDAALPRLTAFVARKVPPSTVRSILKERAINQHKIEMWCLNRGINDDAQANLEDLQSRFPAHDILSDACEALFNLNRYAKHDTTSRQDRDDIYRIKNALVSLLYSKGLATECYLHLQILPAKVCYRCGEQDPGDKCYQCGGTGIFQPSKIITHVCFRFVVSEKTYCWHQPDDLVNFSYVVTKEEGAFEDRAESKDISWSEDQLTTGKQLLEWITSNYHSERMELDMMAAMCHGKVRSS